jgi:hypothetical protein
MTGAVSDLWCSEIPGLSSDRASDLTGRANDDQRVDAVRARYCRAFMRLPGVVSFGKTRLSVWSRRMGAQAPVSAGVLDGALIVGVLDDSYLPGEPLFIEGVPVVVRVTGRPRRVGTTSQSAQG